MSAAKRRRRTSKELELAPESPFFPVVEAARAILLGLNATVRPEDEGDAAAFLRGKIEGIESVILLCQRAGAGEKLEGGQRLVKIERPRLEEALPLEERVERLERRVAELEGARGGMARSPLRVVPAILETPAIVGATHIHVPAPKAAVERKPTKTPTHQAADEELGKCALAILGVLARRADIPTTNAQIATLAKYRESGNFTKALAQLRARGLIRGGAAENRITLAGIAAAGPAAPLPTGRALLEYWVAELGGAAGEILTELWATYPVPLEKAEILHRTGYRESGNFTKALALLRRLKLASKGWPMKASALFEEGGRS